MGNDDEFLDAFEKAVERLESAVVAGFTAHMGMSPADARRLLTIIKDQAAALAEWQQFQPKAEELPVWEGVIGGTE